MIADKLRTIRVRQQVKQSEVANQMGCASTSFTNWESGKVNPPLDQLEKLCGIYGVHPHELLDRRYSIEDIARIAKKPVATRTYEETVALVFCGNIISGIESFPAPDDMELLEVFHLMDNGTRKLLIDISHCLITHCAI